MRKILRELISTFFAFYLLLPLSTYAETYQVTLQENCGISVTFWRVSIPTGEVIKANQDKKTFTVQTDPGSTICAFVDMGLYCATNGKPEKADDYTCGSFGDAGVQTKAGCQTASSSKAIQIPIHCWF